ncbi:autophagy-related protein 2 homolog B-like [Stegodyphus dumicola]|uniref:autophagy-related protein 2 homolog B-like n=1 Tax=Stegodyphus dumicola TaxID=202533 RepID=UPI0015A8FEF9|nr:autophagy-related protein 2 homolog B-like [Stegodyphus dumicola]
MSKLTNCFPYTSILVPFAAIKWSNDAVLANLKVKFYDSVLRIEHVVGNGSSGVALEIKIANAEYFDEAGVNAHCENNQCNADKNTFESRAYAFKNVVFEGVSLYTAEFMKQSRTIPPPKQGFPSDYVDPSQFVPGSPEMPPTHSSLPVKKSEPEVQNDPVLISKFPGQQKLRLQLKQNEAVIGPKVDVEFNLGAFNLFLTPQQVHMLYELMSGFIKPSKAINY